MTLTFLDRLKQSLACCLVIVLGAAGARALPKDFCDLESFSAFSSF